MKQQICGRWDGARNTQMVHTTALHAPDWDVCSQVCKWAGSWCVGIGEQAQSENCFWLWGDGLGNRREEICSRECLRRKTGLPWKQALLLSHMQQEEPLL